MSRIKGKIDSLTGQSRMFNELKGILEDAGEVANMKQESIDDPESLELINEEINQLQEQIDSITPSLLENLLEPEKYDDCEVATVEFRPGNTIFSLIFISTIFIFLKLIIGVGGAESQLFAAEMYHVYKNYCMQNGWHVEEIHFQTEGSGGKSLKLGIFKVRGDKCFLKLKCESGVHKVIRVPETERSGRLHSSAISIVVLPEIPFVSILLLLIKKGF